MKIVQPIAAIVVMGVAVACGDGTLPDISGAWNVQEAFADTIHSLSCESVGLFTVTQPASAEPGETRPGPAFTGTLENDNDCVGTDGPFNYFGDGEITSGVVSNDGKTLSFDAGVNDALCSYSATIEESGGAATDLAGTLTCTLVQAEITFNFAGTWSAANWRSEYCETRRAEPGCAVP